VVISFNYLSGTEFETTTTGAIGDSIRFVCTGT
jgi:hypothetical protein